MWNKRHPNNQVTSVIETERGNEKYRLLTLEDQEYMKHALMCEVCGYKHPPYKADYIS